jgi:hypothetical protein
MSYDTSVSSLHVDLPRLQTKPIDEADRLSPLAEDDPASFDLVSSSEEERKLYSLEKRSELMFSRDHLEEIFAEPALMHKFTAFMSKSRPQAIPLLVYYLDATKALSAIAYVNSVADGLEPLPGHGFSEHPARPTVNSVLEMKAKQAFDALVRDELPAYITHVFIQYVSISIQRRITGTLPPHLRDASEGLAEVFCLTDPSRPDNPIVFASEGLIAVLGVNVRFALIICRISSHHSVWCRLCNRTKLPLPTRTSHESVQRTAHTRRSRRGKGNQRSLPELPKRWIAVHELVDDCTAFRLQRQVAVLHRRSG